MIEHWMTTGLLGANASFKRVAREYAEEYAALAVAAERERCANACKAVEAKYEASGWQYANDLADVADECGRGISGPNV